MAGVLHNRYPCCNRAASLRRQEGMFGRRCIHCQRSYCVVITPALVAGMTVMRAEWTDRQYRKRKAGDDRGGTP
jgi:hypothetical protein